MAYLRFVEGPPSYFEVNSRRIEDRNVAEGVHYMVSIMETLTDSHLSDELIDAIVDTVDKNRILMSAEDYRWIREITYSYDEVDNSIITGAHTDDYENEHILEGINRVLRKESQMRIEKNTEKMAEIESLKELFRNSGYDC